MSDKMLTDRVKSILKSIKYPGYDRDILSFGILQDISVQDNTITVTFKFSTPKAEIKSHIKNEAEKLLKSQLPDYRIIVVESIPDLQIKTGAAKKPGGDPWAGRAPIPGIKHIIAVASGKGGVGKSTVSTNLALALGMENIKTGLMDSDIYGPSVHIMMGVNEQPMVTPDEKIAPIEKFGIRMMSMGFLVDKEAPLIWRGPIVTKAVEQFLRDVAWGELDVLVIDLPPGTGDVQLTLVQKTPVNGAIIVTTPQEVALVDARRGYYMFKKVDTPVYGIVENMSYFTCPKCGEKSYIFGRGGGSAAAKELGVPFLGEIPIEPEVTEAGDSGVPIVARNPESPVAIAFRQIARTIISQYLK